MFIFFCELNHVYLDSRSSKVLRVFNDVDIFQVIQKTWQYNRGYIWLPWVSYFAFVWGHLHLDLFCIQQENKIKCISLQDFYIIDSRVYGRQLIWYKIFTLLIPESPGQVILGYDVIFSLTLMFQLMWIKLFTLDIFGRSMQTTCLFIMIAQSASKNYCIKFDFYIS